MNLSLRKNMVMWSIGLDDLEAQTIRNHLTVKSGPAVELVTWDEARLPEDEHLDRDDPFLILAPLEVWGRIESRVPVLEGVTRAVLLTDDAEDPAEALEAALDGGADDVLRPPLTEERVKAMVDRAASVYRLYGDIYRMTQEIMLERELLSRKNDQLKFINEFLTRTAETLEPASILHAAREELGKIADVTLVHAAVWGPLRSEYFEVELYMAGDLSASAEHAWTSLLLESAAKLAHERPASWRSTPLPKAGRFAKAPAKGRVLILPLKAAGECFGCLAVACSQQLALGRDQVELLHSAVSHLGLAMRNAILFSNARVEAENDGLTHIANRRTFDRRLKEEVERSQRYSQPLAMLLLDLDHFKQINDVHGHLVGDAVLTAVGKRIKDVVRTCDIPARYGGEEFAVILPQTDVAQANILAERLRSEVETMRFVENGARFGITISVGVADTTSESGSVTPAQLVRKADDALYAAKRGGRNMVVSAEHEPIKAAAVQ